MREELTLSPARTRESALMTVAGVVALMALSGLVRIPVPFSPVPITLQTLAVLLIGLTVERQRATVGIAAYLGLGLAGVPFFPASFGPTGGYLVAFLFVPTVMACVRSRMLSVFVAQGFIYALGATWMALWAGVSPVYALLLGVVPFVPADGIKAVLAWRTAEYLNGASR